MNEDKGLFPSGEWIGFWTEPNRPEFPFKNNMELCLLFENERMIGSGRDSVGVFTVKGGYSTKKMECYFHKIYFTHCIYYEGQRDGKGIYGTWSSVGYLLHERVDEKGGFHIWPYGLEEKAQEHLEESEPIKKYQGLEIEKPSHSLIPSTIK